MRDEHFFGASPGTMVLFRRRNYAPLSLVAIRACSSPCAALRRSARLSRGCSSSRRENAETFASLLVPTELSPSSLIFTPRGYKRIRAPHRRSSDCCAPRQSRRAEFLRPCRVFSRYCSPLDYVNARLKLFQEEESISRILGGLHPPRGPRRMYIRKGERSSRATDKRRSLRRRAGEHVL